MERPVKTGEHYLHHCVPVSVNGMMVRERGNKICTIAASKIKGTAREIYRIFPCNGDFPCIPTGCVYRGNPIGHTMVCGLPSRKKTEGVG